MRVKQSKVALKSSSQEKLSRVAVREAVRVWLRLKYAVQSLHIGMYKALLLQVLGSNTEYHLIHKGLPAIRTRRSVSHSRLLKAEAVVGAHSIPFFEIGSCIPISDYY